MSARKMFLGIKEDGQEEGQDYEEDSEEDSEEEIYDDYEELFDTNSVMRQIDYEGDYVKLVSEIIHLVHTASLTEVFFRINLYRKLKVYIRVSDIYLLGLQIIKTLIREINFKIEKQKKVKKRKNRGGRKNRKKVKEEKVKEEKGNEEQVEEERGEKIFVFGCHGKDRKRYFKNSKFLGFGEGYPPVKLIIGMGALERAVQCVVENVETDPVSCISEIFSLVLMLCEGPRFVPLFEDFKEVVDGESPKPLVFWLINDWEVMTRVARKRTEHDRYEKPTDLTNEEEVKKLKENPAWTDDILSIKHNHLKDRNSGNVDESVLKRIIRGFASEEQSAKFIALEEVSNFIMNSSSIPPEFRENLALGLLVCLEDEEYISAKATKLLKRFDPATVLPKLVRKVASSDSASNSCFTSTLLKLLIYNNENPRVILMMLDCISHNNASSAANGNLGALNGDAVNRVFKLIPDWSRSVTNWKLFIGPLVEKMLAEPLNLVILKFLDHISDHLGGEAALVFERILSHTESQTETLENSSNYVDLCQENDVQMKHSHLCPLQILRLLPFKVFDDQKSFHLYGDLHSKTSKQPTTASSDIKTWCIATLLLRRAFNKLESEDVRNLSAELCGRLLPNVLFPTVSSELNSATEDRDILKMKACLLSICTSLSVRGMESVRHSDMSTVKEAIGLAMLGEISEARDGCIDCFAAMVCTEFQHSKTSSSKGEKRTFHKRVIKRLIREENNHSLSTEQFLSYRLCMANVLVSACHKISDSGKIIFGVRTIEEMTPIMINVKEPKVRAACIKVLCNIVNLLKSAILPCFRDLLMVSLNFLQLESKTDRDGGEKLMLLLLGSDVNLQREARTQILSISKAEPSVTRFLEYL